MKKYLFIPLLMVQSAFALTDKELIDIEQEAFQLYSSQSALTQSQQQVAESLVSQAKGHLNNEALMTSARNLVEKSEKHIASYEAKGSESNVLIKGIDLDAIIAQNKNPFRQKDDNDASKPLPSLLVFVSLGMPENVLYPLAEQTAKAGGTLVLRGFYNNQLSQTLQTLKPIIEETGVDFQLDPTLYRLFSVVKVPEIIVVGEPLSPCDASKKVCDRRLPKHDRVRGNVTLYYALEQFSWNGDAKDTALSHLNALQSQQWNRVIQGN